MTIKTFFWILLFCLLLPNVVSSQVCSGNLGEPIFLETFGNGIRADLNTTTSGTTTYCYEDGTGSDCVADTNSYMSCNEATLYSGDPYDLNIYWVTGGDHTGDSSGLMAVFNADFEANEFYRRAVSNLCGGTVFEFAAWIANLYDPMNTPGPCFENNGDGLYPNVNFEIRHPVNDTLIASVATGNVLPTSAEGLPDNIQWEQFGLTFEMPIGLNAIDIVMRNNGDGGCGNDLAIDDITLRSCGPSADIRLESETVCSNGSATFTAIVGQGLTDPYILWQNWNSNSQTWESIGIAGPASQGFNQITLDQLEVIDSIRFIVAGDALSITNPNCPSSSEVYVLDNLIEVITPINDTISLELVNEENQICIQDEFELQGFLDNVIICNEPQNVLYDFSQEGESVCFNFIKPEIEEGIDELCMIVCDDFECMVCDTTIIQLNFKTVIDSGSCFIPNVITPNNDNLNDILYIECLEEIDGALVKVYNRWGNQVYENSNYKNTWDGSYKGKPLPDGVYFYIVDFQDGSGEQIKIAGDLTILQ